MMEGNFENPLEITCAEAADILKRRAQDKSSYMDDKLLEAHLRSCVSCNEMEPEEEKDDDKKNEEN